MYEFRITYIDHVWPSEPEMDTIVNADTKAKAKTAFKREMKELQYSEYDYEIINIEKC